MRKHSLAAIRLGRLHFPSQPKMNMHRKNPRRRVQHVATVSVRYIVHDVDAAIEFYCRNLGFTEVMHPAPAFAMLARGDLRLVLSAAGGGPGGGQAMPDGRLPEPGGWNRFSIEVPDLAATVRDLRSQGVQFRKDRK